MNNAGQQSFSVILSDSSWDIYIGLKHSSEVVVLALELIISSVIKSYDTSRGSVRGHSGEGHQDTGRRGRDLGARIREGVTYTAGGAGRAGRGLELSRGNTGIDGQYNYGSGNSYEGSSAVATSSKNGRSSTAIAPGMGSLHPSYRRIDEEEGDGDHRDEEATTAATESTPMLRGADRQATEAVHTGYSGGDRIGMPSQAVVGVYSYHV